MLGTHVVAQLMAEAVVAGNTAAGHDAERGALKSGRFKKDGIERQTESFAPVYLGDHRHESRTGY